MALERLNECKPALRNWEWRYSTAAMSPGSAWRSPGGLPHSARTASRIATWDVADENSFRVYDLRSGTQTLTLQGPAKVDGQFSARIAPASRLQA